MKYPKKIISILLTVALSFALLHAGTLLSYADTFFEEGDFRFAVMSGEKVAVAKYLGSEKTVTLPETVNGRAVMSVYKNCFESSDIKSVVLPDSYTAIGAFAFNGCESLENVRLSANLETIGIMAFYGCSSLQTIDFSVTTGLKTISFAAFSGCSLLKTAELPDTVTSIGENAFANCGELKSVKLSESLRTIPEYAFYGCALEKAEIPDAVTSLGESCFGNCSALRDIYVPGSVMAIGTNAFGTAEEGGARILCFADSYTAQYCSENEIAGLFILQPGDADLSGDVNISDVTAIQRDLAEMEAFWKPQRLVADVTADGVITIDDATRIQLYLAEYDVPLG